MTPAGVILPMKLSKKAVNHMLPSGPAAISNRPAPLPGVLGTSLGRLNSRVRPFGAIRPILSLQ
ncbi:unannotated protein [freshwater metagenome]|uniref:Unannotated protein n=1 Tax=freshwater metagenome TaxID=449393 RepID=A0A6J7NWI6_9ZZZZ